MKWFLFLGVLIILFWQYNRNLIDTADLDTSVILTLGLGLIKL